LNFWAHSGEQRECCSDCCSPLPSQHIGRDPVTLPQEKDACLAAKDDMALSPESTIDINRFFASIKSLNELDRLEVRNIVNHGLVGSPTNRENYFLLNYNRAVLSVELLLTLTYFKDFQVVAMIGRSLFEIAVEMWMMTKDKDAADKVTAFTEYEKLGSSEEFVGRFRLGQLAK
jgi:hypothetical protein